MYGADLLVSNWDIVHLATSPQTLEWNLNGGGGGEYGGGYTIDTTGGAGGSLGQGGSGGTIELSANSIDLNIGSSELSALGGNSGSAAGAAYYGDPPGITTLIVRKKRI